MGHAWDDCAGVGRGLGPVFWLSCHCPSPSGQRGKHEGDNRSKANAPSQAWAKGPLCWDWARHSAMWQWWKKNKMATFADSWTVVLCRLRWWISCSLKCSCGSTPLTKIKCSDFITQFAPLIFRSLFLIKKLITTFPGSKFLPHCFINLPALCFVMTSLDLRYLMWLRWKVHSWTWPWIIPGVQNCCSSEFTFVIG